MWKDILVYSIIFSLIGTAIIIPQNKTIHLNESLGINDSMITDVDKKQQGNWGYGLRECKPFSPYNNMTDKFVRSLCNV